MAQPHPDDKPRLSDQLKELSGLCLLCSGLPVLIPGLTLTIVGFTSKTDDTFKKFGALHVFGLVLLVIAILLITAGIILKILWRHVLPSDVQRVINASTEDDAYRDKGDLEASATNGKTTTGHVGKTSSVSEKQNKDRSDKALARTPIRLRRLHVECVMFCGITLLIPGLAITILGFATGSDTVFERFGALHVIGLILLIIAIILLVMGTILMIILRVKLKSADHRVGQSPVSKSTSTGQTVTTDNEKVYYTHESKRINNAPPSSKDLPPLKGAPQKQILRSASRTNNLAPLKKPIRVDSDSDTSDTCSSGSSSSSSRSSDKYYTHKYGRRGDPKEKQDIELAQIHKANNAPFVFKQEQSSESVLISNKGSRVNYFPDQTSSEKRSKPPPSSSETEDSDSDSSSSTSTSDSSSTSTQSDNKLQKNYRDRPKSSRVRESRM